MLHSLRGKLIVIFVLLTASAVVISSLFARYQQRNFALNRARERVVRDLESIDNNIQSLLQWVLRDILVLRDLPMLNTLLNAEAADPEEHGQVHAGVEREFLALAAHHQIFQQVRLLDREGREVIRVNTNGKRTWLTERQELQDKSDRYYFQEAVALEPGQVYVSPMDLNIEQGELEVPLVPVIRYATPVLDREGGKQGVLVLNVFAANLLQRIARQQERARDGERYYLLNRDGFFLYHADFSRTFGFMLGHDETFDSHEPGLRGWLDTAEQGDVVAAAGGHGKETLYAYRRIHIPRAIDPGIGGRGPPAAMAACYWILVAAVDDAELLAGFQDYARSFLPFTLALLLAGIVAATLVAWTCSRPVVSLAQAAQKIHRGDLAARARVYTRDEMGRFGALFNEMAAKLEETIARQRRLQGEIVLAAERERRHIGQVLHEEMAQNLALANLRIQEAVQRSCRQPGEGGVPLPVCVHDQLQETRSLLNLMIRQIRTMIFDLYPAVLEKEGLAAAMHWYGANFAKRTGIAVTVYGTRDGLEPGESQRYYLFRAFKELLNNAWKHAGTREIVATIKLGDTQVRLTVDDEGRGFDPAVIEGSGTEIQGIGLLSIRQWVLALGGAMSIESRPGQGTRVALTIPRGGEPDKERS